MNDFPTEELIFDGHLLKRGFWLYVWEVTEKETGRVFYYIGRTGDASSVNAASPLARMGQHLDLRNSAKANMLVRNLKSAKISDPSSCKFRLVAIGPILPESKRAAALATHEERTMHYTRRDVVAALERELEQAMRRAYGEKQVLNRVNSNMPTDPKLWRVVRRQFSQHFRKLNDNENAKGGAIQ